MGALTNLPDGRGCVATPKVGCQARMPAAEAGHDSPMQPVHPARSYAEDLMAAFTVDFDDFFLEQMLVEVVAGMDESGLSSLQEIRGA